MLDHLPLTMRLAVVSLIDILLPWIHPILLWYIC